MGCTALGYGGGERGSRAVVARRMRTELLETGCGEKEGGGSVRSVVDGSPRHCWAGATPLHGSAGRWRRGRAGCWGLCRCGGWVV